MRTDEKLTALCRVFLWDGDLMRCRQCKRGIHFTYFYEPMSHASGCKNASEQFPWADLQKLIPSPTSEE